MTALYFFDGENPYLQPHYSSWVTDFPKTLAPDPTSPQIIAALPPFAAPLLYPLSRLSLKWTKILYLPFFMSSLYWIVYRCTLLYRVRGASIGSYPHTITSILTGAFIFPYGIILSNLQWGSVEILCALGITEFLWQLHQKHYFLSGFFLWLCSLKPHLFILVGMALLFPLIKHERKAFIGITSSVLFAVLVCFAIIEIINPSAFSSYGAYIQSETHFGYTTSSLPSAIASGLGEKPSPIMLLLPSILIGALIGCFQLFKNIFYPIQFLSILLPLSILCSPYAWGHDYLVCIPTIFYIYVLILQKASTLKSFSWLFIFLPLAIANMVTIALAIHFYVPGWSWIVYGLGSVTSTYFASKYLVSH